MQQPTGMDQQAESDNEVNLTPMLDVVFIMLIFFIVTASFVKEAGIDVNPPETGSPDPPERLNIRVEISENNEVWIDNRIIDPRAIRANIERLRGTSPNGSLLIVADRRSTNDMLVRVMDASRHAGIYEISMATNVHQVTSND